jgi:hypothetical protein
MDYPELEIDLFRRSDSHTLDARFRAGAASTDQVLARGVPASYDPAGLRAAALDIPRYGALLGAMLFGDPQMRAAWEQARRYAAYFQIPLRLRLRLDSRAAELHSLCWEALRAPEDGGFLCLDERVLFSRVLDGVEHAPLALPARGQLGALVAVANPRGLGRFGLAPIDVEGEVRRAREALGSAALSILDGQEGRPRASFPALLEQLAAGCDMLYLVCHGTTVEGRSYLWLEREDGQALRVPAEALARQVSRLLRRPALIVLAVCESAWAEHAADGLTALGPLLVRGGAPAVIAANGPLPMPAARRLMPVFFRWLSRTGCVDQALTRARAALSAELDQPWWSLVLWSRVRDGMIWRDAAYPLAGGR